jgi:hypothetical protein
MRQRSGSVKRKSDDTVSYARAVTGSQAQQSMAPEKIEEITVNIAMVTSLCEKAETAMDNVADPVVKDILSDLCKAVGLINKNHEAIVKPNVAGPVKNASCNGMVSLGNISKRNRPDTLNTDLGTVPLGAHMSEPRTPVPVPDVEQIPPEIAKFREAVQKAESSTLIFNLNMGRIPIMNTASMSNKATLALAAMAAENKERPGSIPEEDTIATIDDVLSMAKKIDFYGRKTKT